MIRMLLKPNIKVQTSKAIIIRPPELDKTLNYLRTQSNGGNV